MENKDIMDNKDVTVAENKELVQKKHRNFLKQLIRPNPKV